MPRLRPTIELEDGVSLIELMVSLLIMGMILTSLAGALVTSLRASARQEVRVQSHAVANLALEEAQGHRYRNTALCVGEAQATFGAPLQFDGADLVVLPDTDSQCSEPSRLRPEWTITRDGITFDVQLAVVWVDDDEDQTGASDLDGPQDYKRLVADLSWTERGEARSLRVEGRRAPEALEQPMSVEIDPTVTPLKDVGDGEGTGAVGRNRSSFTLRAVHALKQSSVEVVWPDRDGNNELVSLATDDGGYTWRFTVPQNDGLFANGETIFTFTARDASNDETVSLGRALFLHDLEYRSPTVSQPPEVPSVIEVLPDGTACPFQVNAYLQGMLLSDPVTVTFDAGPSEPTPLTATTQTVRGADYSFDFTGASGFPDPAITSTVSVTFSAERVIEPTPSPVTRTIVTNLVATEVCS